MAELLDRDRQNYVYAGVARGHKAGGFNVQMISDLVTEKIRATPGTPDPDVKARTMYLPEMSWNYEVGVHTTFFENKLRTGITLFYMDISGLQITEFIPTGAGRKLTNAGTSASKGVEISADTYLGSGFDVSANYGFAHATFRNYKDVETIQGMPTEVDYKGKFVPYAPQHTANLALNYIRNFEHAFLSQLYGTISCSGIGKIYWDEGNTLAQNFYGLLDARFGVKKNAFGIEIWGKNLTNTAYNAFYFQSFGNNFFQQGKPLQFGARLTVEI
ncbi:MAG: TonB-dependent receptor domain-containing protein [Paludibacteraceae bacterium]